MTLELKTDNHDSENIFIEHWSHLEKKKRGGPFRSLDDKIDLFVIFMPKKQTAYFFDTARLVSRVHRLLSGGIRPGGNYIVGPEKQIKNKGYTTTGYIIPLYALKSALVEIRRYYGEGALFTDAGY